MPVRRVVWILPALLALAYTQSAAIPPASTMSFEVASIKPSDPNGGRGRSNFPLTEGDRYTPNDGYFNASGMTTLRYIAFAYSLNANPDPQLNALPEWAKTERYDIQARSAKPATKDEMRAMMRTLLADRFQLAAHYEVRNMPAYVLEVVKPGKLGPTMRIHQDDGNPCPEPSAPAAPRAATPDGFPLACGDLMSVPGAPAGRWRLGGRNVTMATFLANFSGGMDRPIVDHTGLTGRYDWVLEYVPDPTTDGAAVANFVQDPTGPKMFTAIKEQLGLEFKATKTDVNFLVFDHIEKPTSN